MTVLSHNISKILFKKYNKILLIITFIQIIVAFFYITYITRRDFEVELLRMASLVTDDLSEQISYAVKLGIPLSEIRGIDESFSAALKNNKSFTYAVLIDSNGKPLFTSGITPNTQYLTTLSKKTGVTDYPTSFVLENHINIMDNLVLNKEIIGSVHMGVDTSLININLMNAFYMFILLMVLGIFLSYSVTLLSVKILFQSRIELIHGSIQKAIHEQKYYTIFDRKKDIIGLIIETIDFHMRKLNTSQNLFFTWVTITRSLQINPSHFDRIDQITNNIKKIEIIDSNTQELENPNFSKLKIYPRRKFRKQNNTLLRTKISIITFLAGIFLFGGIIWAISIRDQYGTWTRTDSDIRAWSSLWNKTIESNFTRLASISEQVINNKDVIYAIHSDDPTTVSSALQQIGIKTDIQIQIISFSGSIVAGIPIGRSFQSILDASLLDLIKSGERIHTIHPDNNKATLAIVATPIQKQENSYILVVANTLQLSLNELANAIGGETFLVNRRGAMMAGTNSDLWHKLNSPPRLRQDGISIEQIDNNNYTIGTIPINDNAGRTVVRLVTVRNDTIASNKQWNATIISLFCVIFFLLIIQFFLHIYLRRSFNPLNDALGVLDRLAHNDLSATLIESGRDDEFGRISNAIAAFRNKLVAAQSADQLASTLRQKEGQLSALRHQLEIAAQIQQSFIPQHFPVSTTFSVYALMKPANEVGGDLYDVFTIDDKRIGFTVGDVSGKGIPAALFMAVSRTLIRLEGTTGATPSRTLEHTNKGLAADNDAMMFVTLYYGSLNSSTGEIAFSNAGHPPPYRITTDGNVSVMSCDSGISLGIDEEASFKTEFITLRPGETLFLYTDGITEAFNPNEEAFGETRLEQCLHRCYNEDVKNLAISVLREVESFACGAPQSDDITCLAIRYHGLPSNKAVTFL
ncbi:phosphoserine phosphatase RsbU/P [Azospirillaceae bacterium]